jgi:hypothetical protein
MGKAVAKCHGLSYVSLVTIRISVEHQYFGERGLVHRQWSAVRRKVAVISVSLLADLQAQGNNPALRALSTHALTFWGSV